MSAVDLIVLFVALQRLAELVYANRNTRRLIAAGGVEHGARHYPLFVLLHTAWLVSVWYAADPTSPINTWLLGFFVGLQALRVWVVATLGEFWTTRIITLASAPLVHGGPYRLMRHPNYVVVVLEIAALPMVFGIWKVALIFSVLNLLLLAWRIRVEDAVLKPRRQYSLSGR